MMNVLIPRYVTEDIFETENKEVVLMYVVIARGHVSYVSPRLELSLARTNRKVREIQLEVASIWTLHFHHVFTEKSARRNCLARTEGNV